MQRIVFHDIPKGLNEFTQLYQANMKNPFDTAALTVLALSVYEFDADSCFAMLDFLRGPRAMSYFDRQFISERLLSMNYLPRSYFVGATPDNDYHVSKPYIVEVQEIHQPYSEENYAKLYIASGGSDSFRAVQLKLDKDGKWYLWEQFLLVAIPKPKSESPWVC